MNPIKLIRKLGKLLRGGSTSRQIFLGVFLGFAAGMIPGLNLTLLVCIFLLLILNTNTGLGVMAFALGKVPCLAAAPVTFRMGYFMIHNMGLKGPVQATADTPVLALLDLHVYCLMGALPLIIVIGGVLGWGLAGFIAKLRAGILAAKDRSEKLQQIASKKFVRFMMWLAFGGQKEDLVDTLSKKSPLFLRGRLISGLVLVGVVVALSYLFLDTLARQGIERAISAVSGAEVNVAKADLSLLSGQLVIEGLQVTDAARPTHNQVQAERIVSDISIKDVLAKRFVIDLIQCDTMLMDVQRKTPGRVYADVKEEKEPIELDLGDAGSKVRKYYEQVKKLNERFAKLKDYLKSGDPAGKEKPSKAELEQMARAHGFLRLSAREYLAEHPVWVIHKATVSGLIVHEELPAMTVEARDMSSHPSLYPETMTIEATPDEQAVKEFMAKGAGAVQKEISKALKDKASEGAKDGLLKDIFK